MNKGFYAERPIITAGTCVILFTFLILKFSLPFVPVFLAASAFIGALIFIYRNNFFNLFLCAGSVVLSIAISYTALITLQMPSQKLLTELDGQHTFKAKVTDFCGSSKYTSIELILLEADSRKFTHSYRAKASIFGEERVRQGDIIEFSATPESFYDTEADDGFDNGDYLRSKKIFINFPSIKITDVTINKNPSLILRLREYIDGVYTEFLSRNYNYTYSQISTALVTGQKDSLDKEIKDSFRKSGILHLLCVSGMHLTVILGFVFLVLRAFTVNKKHCAVIIIFVCVFYTVLTGFTPAVIRAGIMSCIAYSAALFGARADGIKSLFAAGALICLFNPYAVLNIGAQLSFVSTFGIIMSYSVLTSVNSVLRKVLVAFLANISAYCFTLAVSAYSFGEISLFSVPATIVCSPICDVVLVLLILLVLMSPLCALPLFGFIVRGMSEVCILLIKAMIGIAHYFSGFEYSYIPSPVSSKVFVTALVILLFFSAVFMAKGKLFCFRVTFVSILCMGLVMTASAALEYKYDSSLCKVFYYRKNANDTQISIKLPATGALIVNSDSLLCTDKEKAYFDTFSQNNTLLILPSTLTDAKILSESIKDFENRFGLKNILIADINACDELCSRLKSFGLNCTIISDKLYFRDILIEISSVADTSRELTSDTPSARLQIRDKNNLICIVMSDEYALSDYPMDSDMCAYLTTKTNCQFNLQSDQKPDCNIFFTRLKKGQNKKGISNTFGQKTVRLY